MQTAHHKQKCSIWRRKYFQIQYPSPNKNDLIFEFRRNLVYWQTTRFSISKIPPTTNIMHRRPPDSRLLTAKYDRQQQYCEKQTGTAHQGVRMTQILKLSSSLSQSLRFHCDSDRGHRLLKITKHLVVTNSGSNMSGDNNAKFAIFWRKPKKNVLFANIDVAVGIFVRWHKSDVRVQWWLMFGFASSGLIQTLC